MCEILESAAYIRGRRDGLNLLSPRLSPYPPGSAEAEQYRQGLESARRQVEEYAERAMRMDAYFRSAGNEQQDREAMLVARGRAA